MSKLFAPILPRHLPLQCWLAVLAAALQFGLLAATPPTLTGAPSGRSFGDLRIAAEKGDPIAQRLVANAYLTGEGVKQDYTEALRWLRLAAGQRDPFAQYVLGILHDEGRGVPRDLREAVKWYELAAQQGLPDAQFNLGICYSRGEGIPKDGKKAAEWFRKAATQGDAQSQSSLGLAYITGNGVERNPVEAASWLRKAAYQEDAKAQFFLGRLYQEGEGVPQEPDTAVKWLRKAAQQGYSDAQFHLGRALIAGEGVERNPAEGRDWMEKAAAHRHESATQYLAQLSRDRFNPAAPTATAPAGASEKSPMTAAATRSTSAELGGLFTAPRETLPGNPPPAPAKGDATGSLTFPAPSSATNLTAFAGLREPLAAPALPALSPPTNSAGLPPAPKAAAAAAKEPSLPPFTVPAGKEAATGPTSPDLFTLPPTGKGAESGLTEPPRMREPEPTRVRDTAPAAPASSGGGESNGGLMFIAAISTGISALILVLGVYVAVVFKARLHGLEAELKKAQFELSKANVNLSAMMHQVEQLSLMAPANTAPAKASLPEWSTEAPKAHTASFKMHRSK